MTFEKTSDVLSSLLIHSGDVPAALILGDLGQDIRVRISVTCNSRTESDRCELSSRKRESYLRLMVCFTNVVRQIYPILSPPNNDTLRQSTDTDLSLPDSVIPVVFHQEKYGFIDLNTLTEMSNSPSTSHHPVKK